MDGKRTRSGSTLVIVLEDSTHRVTQWDHAIDLKLAQNEIEAQGRSRLHQIVSAYLFVGREGPRVLV